MAWITHAPAKVNLDLRMHGVRGDGYHLLTTVLQSIALADTLTLRARPGPFGIVCTAVGVPTDARNLAWKGAAAMATHLGVPLEGWELAIEKRVPAEAGLGGGSADAAAAARLIASAAGRSVDAAELAEVIGPLGADVAFFAWGGTMRGEGVGDVLTPLPDEPAASVLLVRPPFGVSTAQAYGWFDETLNAERRTLNRRRTPNTGRRSPNPGTAMSVADDRGGNESRGPSPGNDLEGPVAARHPEITAIVERLRGAGAARAGMSGSGSACFGLFDPAANLGALASGWPDGTCVWHTRAPGPSRVRRTDRCPTDS